MRADTGSNPGNKRGRTLYAMGGLRWGLLPEESASLEKGEERAQKRKEPPPLASVSLSRKWVSVVSSWPWLNHLAKPYLKSCSEPSFRLSPQQVQPVLGSKQSRHLQDIPLGLEEEFGDIAS